MDTTKTVTYDVTILEDFTEVTRTKEEALLYNKYFPEFSRRYSDGVIFPGAYRFVVVEDAEGSVISLTFERVVYTRKEQIISILKSIFSRKK